MAIDNQTLFDYSLGALSLMLWYVAYKFFAFVLELGPVQDVIAPSESMMIIIPFLLGLGAAGGAFMAVRRHEAARRFGVEVVVELKKVVWPTRKEVRSTTTAVLIVVFIVAFFLFVFDKLFQFFIAILIK